MTENKKDNPLPQQPTVKKGKGKVIILATIFVMLITGITALGYFYREEIEAHKETTRQLGEQTKMINDNAQVIRDSKMEPGFRGVLQDVANRECHPFNSAVLFNITTSEEKYDDGSVKQYFGVGQYICSHGDDALGSKIRFATAQSMDGIQWSFTYGSTPAEPTSLPNYIYNTDPELYKRKYNNPSNF